MLAETRVTFQLACRFSVPMNIGRESLSWCWRGVSISERPNAGAGLASANRSTKPASHRPEIGPGCFVGFKSIAFRAARVVRHALSVELDAAGCLSAVAEIAKLLA
jgi:hypothetical protein